MSRLEWQHYGCGKHPDLILVHGWGMRPSVWNPLISPLLSHFNLHIVALPGYGLRPDHAPLSVAEVSEQLVADVTKPAWWLGWSMGGLVTTEIMATYPTKTLGHILVASPPCFIAQPDCASMSRRDFLSFRGRFAHQSQATYEQFALLACLGDRHHQTQQHFLVQNRGLMPEIAILEMGLDWLANTDQRLKFKQINQPQLIILGRNDKIVPFTVAAFYRQFSHNQVIVLPQRAHLPFYPETEAFIARIVDFIAQA